MEKLRLNIQLFGGSLSITASETDVSIENNTSYINLVIKATTNSTTYNDSAYLKSASIVGQNDTYSLGRINFSIGKGQTVTVYSGKIGPFHHNNDGTLNNVSISASCYIVSNTQPSASASVPMSTIPRASSISVADANIGSSTNIVINRASDTFTTTLYYKATGQNSWTKIVDKTSNQVYGWNVPTSFYNLIPNSKTIYCEFYADTYSGDTFIGTSSVVGATFTANTYPSVVSTNWHTDDQLSQTLTGNSTTIIKGVSELYIEINANAGTGASLSSYVINGVSSSSNDRTIYNADTDTYNITIYDSRGMEGWGSITTGFVDYIPLTINANITRNQPTDGKVNISASGNYFNGDFRTSYHNTLTIEYRYKERSSSTWSNWTTLSTTITNNSYSGSTQLSDFDYTNIYDFEIRATDRVGTQTITGLVVTKGIPVYNWDNDEFDVNVDLYNKTFDLFNDTSGTDWQNMMKNKLDYCIDNINTSKQSCMAFINGGWNGVNWGFGMFSKIGTTYQLVWYSLYGTFYVRKINNDYDYHCGTDYFSTPPSNDLNNAVFDGKYMYDRGATTYANSPTNDGIHILNVYSNGPGGSYDWLIQEDYKLVYAGSSAEKYIRMKSPTGWTSWQRII